MYFIKKNKFHFKWIFYRDKVFWLGDVDDMCVPAIEALKNKRACI